MKYFQHMEDIEHTNKVATIFKTIIPSSRVRDIEAFKKEHGDFYDDFAPWILKEACKFGVISLVTDILKRHPDICDYEFYDTIGVMRRVSVSGLESAVSSDKYYPLEIAAELGHFDICKLLINAGFKCMPKAPANAPGPVDVLHAFCYANYRISSSPNLAKYLELFVDQDINEEHLVTFLNSDCDLRHEHNLDLFNRIFHIVVKGDNTSPPKYFVSLLSKVMDGEGNLDHHRCRAIESLPHEFVEKLESSIFEVNDFPLKNGQRASLLEVCLSVHNVYSPRKNQCFLLKKAIERANQDAIDRLFSNQDMVSHLALKENPDFAHEMIFERASLSALERFVQNYEMEGMSGSVFSLANACLINKKILTIDHDAEANMTYRVPKSRGL